MTQQTRYRYRAPQNSLVLIIITFEFFFENSRVVFENFLKKFEK